MGRGKRGKSKFTAKNTKEKIIFHDFTEKNMDDEIDIFHKQKDKIPLNIDEDGDDSDEELEQPVLDLQMESSDESGEESESEDDEQLTGLAAKIAKQAKILKQKTGGVDEDIDEDEEEDEEEEKKAVWGKRKQLYYNADNVDYEIQSSDEEMPAEEEAEVLRLQRKRAESLRPEDFGLEEDEQEESDADSDGHEETLQEAIERQEGAQHQKPKKSAEVTSEKVTNDGKMEILHEVKKDINALSKEQQMDVVMSDAPELVGLLSEFKEAHNSLKLVESVMSKLKGITNATKEGLSYVEVKHQLLLCYCQAIVFYLLLKAEGQPVRDHPIIARLVEIRKLLDRIQPLDNKVKNQFEEILNGQICSFNNNSAVETDTKEMESNGNLHILDTQFKPCFKDGRDEGGVSAVVEPDVNLLQKTMNKNKTMEPIGEESKAMLNERSRLEAYLDQLKDNIRQVAVAKSEKNKPKNKLKRRPDRNLESLEDFDDDVADMSTMENVSRAHSEDYQPRKKVSQLVAEAGKATKKPKILSGDYNLPEKEDLGERRRKYEMRKCNTSSLDEGLENNIENSDESEDEFYKEVKQKRNAALSAKSEKYLRKPSVAQPEEEVEGKRQITYQMEKNKGLTPHRKKKTKNPRKKYKLKHEKALVRRKGQVREVKLPQGPYGGEATGIRTAISRSIRFNH